MSALLRGLDQGLQTGLRLGGTLRDARQRRALQEESARYNVTEGAYGPELEQNIEQLQGLRAQDPAQAAAYDQAIAELQRRSQMTAPDFTVASGAQNFATREEATRAARPMRAEGLARVYERFGDVEQAEALRERADAGRFRDLQFRQAQIGLRRAEREDTFDTTIEQIYSNPELKGEALTNAVLDAVGRFQGPQARAQLEATYTQNELSTMARDSQRMQQGIQQALLKGVDNAIKWFDEQNDSFQLERQGNNVFRINQDGSRELFVQGRNDQDLAMQLEQRAKPGGLLELAKFNVDMQNAQAQRAYYEARIAALQAEDRRATQQLSNVSTSIVRGPDGQLQQVMTGVRFNRVNGNLETVSMPLEQMGVPMSALDPKRIQEVADTLVGKPIDPTNTGRKARRHTEASARQAAVDMIVNSYLGDGSSAAPDVGIDVRKVNEYRRTQGQSGTEPAARTTPTRPAPAPDPARRSADVSPVTGLARETPATAPNLVEAAGRALSAGERRYLEYLQAKIDRNEPLTPDEQARVRRLGL